MQRKFTLAELKKLRDINEDIFYDEREQTSASQCAIFFKVDDKKWRIYAKTNSDGEDELNQSLQYADKYPEDFYNAESVNEKNYEILEPGMWENDDGPSDWWAVANDDGIVAYFGCEPDALAFQILKSRSA